MKITIQVTDKLDEEWDLIPGKFECNRNGMYIFWANVKKGPPSLTEGGYPYQRIPLPVFTEWWPDEA